MANVPQATTLEQAIQYFNEYTLAQFNAAYKYATEHSPLRDDASDQEKKQLANAQGQMTSALQQLVQMKKLSWNIDEHGDAGYGAVVTLMQNTGATAEAVFERIRANVAAATDPAEQQRRNQQLNVLGDVLQALARLSPVPVWHKDSSAPNGG